MSWGENQAAQGGPVQTRSSLDGPSYDSLRGNGGGMVPTARPTISTALAELEQELAEVHKLTHVLGENLTPILSPGNDRKDPGGVGGARQAAPGIVEAVYMLTDRARGAKMTLMTILDRLAI